MASAYDVLINFTAKDNATVVANKTAAAVDNVAKSGNNATTSMKGLAGGVSSFMGALSIGALVGFAGAMANAGISAVTTANKFDNVRKSLQLMLKDKVAGDELYATMEQLAARTPFSFDDVAQGTQKLLAMGFAAKDIPSLMTTIGDAASALGAGSEGIDRISRGLGQMQAKGKITTEEMMQLQEMGIPAFKLLADATGVSQQALMDMVSKGMIPAEGNLKTLIDAMTGQYGGMMASQMDTATAAQSNFQDASDKAAAAVGRVIQPQVIAFYENASDVITRATGAYERWVKKIEEGGGWYVVAAANADALNKATFAQDAYIGKTQTFNAAAGTSKTALNVIEKAAKDTGKSYISLGDANDRLASAQKRLIQVNRNLRDSYFAISDAQRNVKATREALEDATNPRTLEEFQIAADRAFYSNELLNNEIKRMEIRQKDVRAQLAKGNLTQDERNSLMQEDAQITEDLIGKRIDARQSVIDLEKAQKALDRARDPARIQEYVDANQQAINKVNDLTVDQGILAQSTNSLNGEIRQATNAQISAYGAAVNSATAQGELNKKLNDGTIQNARNKDELIKLITPLTNATTSTGLYNDKVNATNTAYLAVYTAATGNVGFTAGIKAADEAMLQSKDKLEDYRKKVLGVRDVWNEAKDAVNKFQDTLKKTIDALSGTGGGTGTGNQGGGGGGGTTTTSWKDAVYEDYVKYTENDGVLSSSEMNSLTALAAAKGGNSQDAYNYVLDLISKSNGKITFQQGSGSTNNGNGRSLTGTSAVGGGKTQIPSMSKDTVGLWSGANVTITLNYASPPDSKNPLADVEDYVTAQGGLVRI